MHTQDPSVGLSWPLALAVANGGLALDQCTERLRSSSLPFHRARKGGTLPGAMPRSHRPCHSPILWVTAAVPMSLGTPRWPATQEGQPATLSLCWWEGKSRRSACECQIHVNNPSEHLYIVDVYAIWWPEAMWKTFTARLHSSLESFVSARWIILSLVKHFSCFQQNFFWSYFQEKSKALVRAGVERHVNITKADIY